MKAFPNTLEKYLNPFNHFVAVASQFLDKKVYNMYIMDEGNEKNGIIVTFLEISYLSNRRW